MIDGKWTKWQDLSMSDVLILLNRITQEKINITQKIETLKAQIQKALDTGDKEDADSFTRQVEILIKERFRWTAL
jgi:propanediol dehydratase small subunit